MKKLHAILLGSIGLLSSCGPDYIDVAIDNPLNEPVIVTIDSLVVEVPGRQVAWVEMGVGEHQVKLENDTTFNYNFTEKVYFLNPTRTHYLKSEAVYGNPGIAALRASALPSKKVNFLGLEIEGNYDVVTDILTPVTWDYGPREELPEAVEMDQYESYVALIRLSDPMEIIEQIQASAASQPDSTTGSESELLDSESDTTTGSESELLN